MKKLRILESLRGLASIYVAAGHWLGEANSFHLKIFFQFGQEAVIVFFLLSGFVIYLSYESGREKSLLNYFVKRFRRIYFPLICALLLSCVVNQKLPIKELIGNLLMLQDFKSGKPGNIVSPFLANRPLWSLSYEWTFYVIFPFIYPVIKNLTYRGHIIGIFSFVNILTYILFPNHIFAVFAYFIIWWTGLELAEYFLGDRSKSQYKTIMYYLLLIIITLGINCFLYHQTNRNIIIGFYPYLFLRHFLFAFVCLISTVYLTSFCKKAGHIISIFSKIAPISYGIYILHYPILVQSDFHFSAYLAVPLKIVLVVGLAYLIDVVLQPKINKLLNFY